MSREWNGRSHGGGIGQRIVAIVARLGALVVYPFICVPVTWLWWRDVPARRASVAWWQRLRPNHGRWGCLFLSWLHFHAFGRSLVDRMLAFMNPDSMRTTHVGEPVIRRAIASDRGRILLSAHLGNWELSGRWLTRYGNKRVHIVMLKGEDPRVEQALHEVMGDHPFSIIDLREPTAAALAIASALSAGETCCMLGDRNAGDQAQLLPVSFCGGTAYFPKGPFVAALATGALVVPVFALKRNVRDYVMVVDRPISVHAARRRERHTVISHAVQQWAATLERFARGNPYQWNNFYDFWRAPSSTNREQARK